MDASKLSSIALEISAAIRQELRDLKIEASGNLISSVKTEIELDGIDYAVIVELASYYKFIEEGRHSGRFPPPDSIKDWIRFKPIVPRLVKGKVPSTNQLAYVIGRKIAKDGIKPKPFIDKVLESPTIDRLTDEICELVYADYVSELNNEIDKIYDN